MSRHHPDTIPADVYHLRWHVAGLGYEAAAALCGIHTRTIKRWEQAGRCPVWFEVVCRSMGGELAALRGGSMKWDGWRLHGGDLVSPEGVTYSPYEINSIPWLWAMVADLRRELRHTTAPGVQQVLPFPEIRRLP